MCRQISDNWPNFRPVSFKFSAPVRKLQEASAQRLGLSVANITTIVIGKSGLDPSSQGNVTVEVSAEEAPFQRSGRVNWEIDGREIKAYLP